MEKRNDVTVGYKIVEEGKPTRYYAECTGEGMCYKDINAFDKNDDVCYIPECEFKSDGWCMEDCDGLGYTREEVISYVKDACIDLGIPGNDEFDSSIARSCVEVAEWESIGIVLDRIDLEEEWKIFNNK